MPRTCETFHPTMPFTVLSQSIIGCSGRRKSQCHICLVSHCRLKNIYIISLCCTKPNRVVLFYLLLSQSHELRVVTVALRVVTVALRVVTVALRVVTVALRVVTVAFRHRFRIMLLYSHLPPFRSLDIFVHPALHVSLERHTS